jgi:hypothetical protein
MPRRPATFPQVYRIIAPTLSAIFGHCLTVFKLILLPRALSKDVVDSALLTIK